MGFEWLKNFGRKKPTRLELAEMAREEMLDELHQHIKGQATDKGLQIEREENAVTVRAVRPHLKEQILRVAVAPLIASGRAFVPEITKLPWENFSIRVYEGPGSYEHRHSAGEMEAAKRKITEIIQEHIKSGEQPHKH